MKLVRPLVLSLATAGITVLAPATVTQAAEACDPADKRTYTVIRSSWYAYDSGTLRNRSNGTLSKTYTHSTNKSLNTTKSAEVGGSVSSVVAEINAKFGISVSATASYTTSTSFTVKAPAHTSVSYKDGIKQRTYSVKRVHLDTRCRTSTTYGSVQAADNVSVAS